MSQEIVSYKEAARRLDLNERTISDLVRLLGIEPTSHPSNGRAKGLTSDHMGKIRAWIRRRPVAQPA
jgi:transposase